MPTCRGVTITLQSQFGAQLLPEVPCSDICPLRLASPSLDLPHLPDLLLTPFDTLPAPPSSPFWQHRATIGLDNGLPAGRTTSTTNDDDRLETVDVGVKAIPGCHLWINYKCKLPATGSYPYTPQYPSPQVSRETMIIPHCRPVKYLFFRLFINDRCIQRWGTKLSSASLSESKEEQINGLGFHPGSTVLRQECNGRLMFGIFRADAKTFAVSSTGLERRAICFAKRSTRRCKAEDHRHILDPVVEADILEIQVFRSFGRTWDTVDEHSAIGASELSNDTSTNSDVIRTVRSGHVRRRDPRRMYRYALIEPVDSPYAVFRFHCANGEDTSQRALGNIASTSYPQGIDLLGSRRPLAFDSNLVEDDEKPGPPTSDVSGGDLSHSPPSSPAYTPPRRHSDTLHAVNLFSKPLPKIPEGSPTKRRSASPKRVDRRLLHKQVRLSSVPDLSRPESGLDSDASAPSRNRASTALTSILAGALKRRVGTGFESADVEGLD